MRRTCSRTDFMALSINERGELAGDLLSLIQDRYPVSEFGYDSFPELQYDQMVLSAIFHELKESGKIKSTGYLVFRLEPSSRGTAPQLQEAPRRAATTRTQEYQAQYPPLRIALAVTFLDIYLVYVLVLVLIRSPLSIFRYPIGLSVVLLSLGEGLLHIAFLWGMMKLNHSVARGKNWARLTVLSLLWLNCVLQAYMLAAALDVSGYGFTPSILGHSLLLAILVPLIFLLHSGPSRQFCTSAGSGDYGGLFHPSDLATLVSLARISLVVLSVVAGVGSLLICTNTGFQTWAYSLLKGNSGPDESQASADPGRSGYPKAATSTVTRKAGTLAAVPGRAPVANDGGSGEPSPGHQDSSTIKQSEDSPDGVSAQLRILLNSKSPEEQILALQAIADIGPAAAETVPFLFALYITTDKRDLRKAISTTVRRIGAPGIAEVQKALLNEDIQIRIRASELLGDVGPAAKSAIPSLIAALARTKESEFRSSAVRAISRIDPTKSQLLAEDYPKEPMIVPARPEDAQNSQIRSEQGSEDPAQAGGKLQMEGETVIETRGTYWESATRAQIGKRKFRAGNIFHISPEVDRVHRLRQGEKLTVPVHWRPQAGKSPPTDAYRILFCFVYMAKTPPRGYSLTTSYSDAKLTGDSGRTLAVTTMYSVHGKGIVFLFLARKGIGSHLRPLSNLLLLRVDVAER